MMAGNPNSWSMNGMHPQSQFVYGSNSSNPSSTTAADHPSQDFPVRSWSQLLLGGSGVGEEERFGASLFHQQKKLENWEDQVLNLNPSSFDVKQEAAQSSSCQIYDDEFKPSNSWPVSSPTSCVTSLFNFSAGKPPAADANHSSECNSTITGGVSKKARVQQSSAQPALKVRKEKLGDRITALHQLVSPFGKTDTASVLSEAIGYIRFLQGQIEVQERNCLFPEEDSESEGGVKDLRSRGLCLVPISCTQNVGNESGADYWAPAALGGGF
ncbi:transcription factor bHLH68-like isoform X2 [Salvia miltiorrhiza]|uniref:transcription factor bHLH68-like isoform X2 n=1 Tax=Salvia miltiorrhiza TaxID=226208 RepID=UPI0025AB62C2|nr:transcription factor bHLH68-like isoform X2 [Salvia miltiorrhiza]